MNFSRIIKALITKVLLFFSTLFLILSFASTSFSQDSAEDVIQAYDVSSYHPHIQGLKDLVADIRVPELVKQLNERLIFGKLKDVFFRLYWVNTGKVDIEVYGMPRGFQEIKANLISIVQNRLDIIIPKLLVPELKGRKLTVQTNSKEAIKIKAIDLARQKFITEVNLEFDHQHRLKKLTTVGPAGAETAEFSTSKKNWGDNKWIIDEIKVTSIANGQTTSTTNKITYEKFANLGLPSQIESKTQLSFREPSSTTSSTKDKEESKEFSSSLVLSNYKVNEGFAKLYFKRKMGKE